MRQSDRSSKPVGGIPSAGVADANTLNCSLPTNKITLIARQIQHDLLSNPDSSLVENSGVRAFQYLNNFDQRSESERIDVLKAMGEIALATNEALLAKSISQNPDYEALKSPNYFSQLCSLIHIVSESLTKNQGLTAQEFFAISDFTAQICPLLKVSLLQVIDCSEFDLGLLTGAIDNCMSALGQSIASNKLAQTVIDLANSSLEFFERNIREHQLIFTDSRVNAQILSKLVELLGRPASESIDSRLQTELQTCLETQCSIASDFFDYVWYANNCSVFADKMMADRELDLISDYFYNCLQAFVRAQTLPSLQTIQHALELTLDRTSPDIIDYGYIPAWLEEHQAQDFEAALAQMVTLIKTIGRPEQTDSHALATEGKSLLPFLATGRMRCFLANALGQVSARRRASALAALATLVSNELEEHSWLCAEHVHTHMDCNSSPFSNKHAENLAELLELMASDKLLELLIRKSDRGHFEGLVEALPPDSQNKLVKRLVESLTHWPIIGLDDKQAGDHKASRARWRPSTRPRISAEEAITWLDRFKNPD